MKDYLITYWWGIPEAYFSEERVIEAIEDGFNLLHFSYEPENNKKALALCQKHGVRAMIADGRMYKAMNEPENREKILTALTDDYKNEPALFGYYVTDEPNADQFPMLADIVATLKRLDPAHPAYINLFPNYANAAQLGNPTYDAHLRAYMETVKPEILSYDHYHLLTTEQPKEFITFDNEREAGIYAAAQKRTARAGFYDNIEAIRRYGLEFAVPYMLIILLTEHGPYRYLSEPEIAYEAYQTLAYGCSMLSYFTYWTPDGGDHCTSATGSFPRMAKSAAITTMCRKSTAKSPRSADASRTLPPPPYSMWEKKRNRSYRLLPVRGSMGSQAAI